MMTGDVRLPFWFPCALLTGLLVAGFLAGGPASAGTAREQCDAVVVGGGIAGLVAAYELQENGLSVHLLESAGRFGGRVATTDYGPAGHAEWGLHEIWEKDPLRLYARKLGVRLEKPKEPYSSIVIDGTYYPYVQENTGAYLATVFTPNERKAFDRLLKRCEKLCDESKEKGLTKELAKLQEISFLQWIATLDVPPKVAECIRLSIECEIATDWKNISALYGISHFSIFVHRGQKCFHAAGGNDKVTGALARAIRGTKTLGARVTRIARTRTGSGATECTVHYLRGQTMESVRCRKVVLAVPYHLVHSIQLEPSLSDLQWKAIETLKPGSYLAVHLVVDVAANRLLLINGKNPFPVLTRGPLGVVYGLVDLPRGSQKEEIFCVLIHGDHAKTYLEPLDRLRATVLSELDKLWPGLSKYVHGAYFYSYHPAAIPNWGPGRSPLDSLSRSLLFESVGLYLAGDYVGGGGAEGAVESARMAAAAIAKELKRN